MRYLAYSEYMKRKYGGKVYKLPVNLPVTCPNRMGDQGCTFCGEQGAGFENLSASLSVTEQLRRNMEYIGKRYGADLFAAYFQNFTNTFLPLEEFRNALEEAARFPEVAEICISTRPDCISDAYLDVIAAVCGDSGKVRRHRTRTSEYQPQDAEKDKQRPFTGGIHRRDTALSEARI